MNQKGVTLVEVVMTLAIIGMMITPVITNLSSIRGTEASIEEYILAVFLAQEKMELLEVIPYSRIRGDFSIFSKIFSNVEDGKFANISGDEEAFYSVFSDVITGDFAKQYEMIDRELKQVYLETYGIEYETYRPFYKKLRRICKVEEKEYEKKYSYKEITVSVFDEKKNRELITLKTIRVKQ